MPPEMLETASNLAPYNSTGSFSPLASKQAKKDRSCKGKRYLEMLNEGKLVKRNKCSVGGNGNEDSVSGSKNNSSSSPGTTGSKWVSGGFDLEEHIAALPQLGDTHLINALSHNKANKGLNGNKANNNNNGGSTDHKESETNEIPLNSKSNEDEKPIDRDTQLTKSDRSEVEEEKLNHNNLERQITNNIRFNDMDTKDKSDDEELVVDDSHSVGDGIVKTRHDNYVRSSHGISDCDGLTALAEVALQQAHRNVISSPTSL